MVEIIVYDKRNLKKINYILDLFNKINSYLFKDSLVLDTLAIYPHEKHKNMPQIKRFCGMYFTMIEPKTNREIPKIFLTSSIRGYAYLIFNFNHELSHLIKDQVYHAEPSGHDQLFYKIEKDIYEKILCLINQGIIKKPTL